MTEAPSARPPASWTTRVGQNVRVRRVCILGSTGSIGTQALDVIERNPDRFVVVGLAAGGGNAEVLAAQARRHPEATVASGPDAALELATLEADVVLNGVAGLAGLEATVAAIGAGRTVALANKESLIAGGPLLAHAVDRLLPVDSEHSALWQCLLGSTPGSVRRLVITASGGPFRGRCRAELADVTVEQALAHPTWTMGPLVTVNSATLVNKGLEVIEGALLFGHHLPGDPYDAIEAVVHPQSLVHSMVEMVDGSTIAQVSPADMRTPIALALAWPGRVPDAAPAMDWTRPQELTFEPLDHDAFPAVRLAKAAGRAGGTAPAVYAAAAEAAVGSFLSGRGTFLSIVDVVEEVLARHQVAASPTLDDIRSAIAWATEEVGRS
jgi:1-deoxy-D-xylulose-5-phosphate reductoisomerase